MAHRPLVVAGAVAAVSTGLLVLAVAAGWLGPDVGRGANFCEAARDGLLRQPVNTWSNAGFVVAGLVIAGHAERARASSAMPRATQTAYACVVVLLGPASAAMHATQSAWGGRLDMLSMYLVAAFAASYALTRLLGLGTVGFAVAYVVLVALCEVVEQRSGPVPLVLHAGNAAFATLLVLAVLVEVVLWRRGVAPRDVRFAGAALGTLVVAFAIWFAAQHGWCDPHSLIQGHAVWHLLCAVAAYLLHRFYASEQSLSPRRTRRRRPGRPASAGRPR